MRTVTGHLFDPVPAFGRRVAHSERTISVRHALPATGERPCVPAWHSGEDSLANSHSIEL